MGIKIDESSPPFDEVAPLRDNLVRDFAVGAGQAADLEPFLGAASFYGIHPPPPLSGFLKVDGQAFQATSILSETADSSPHGFVGLMLALHWIGKLDGVSPSVFFPDGWTAEHQQLALEQYGSRPVVTVCATDREVKRRLEDALQGVRLTTWDARNRSVPRGMVSVPIPDELSLPYGPAEECLDLSTSTPRGRFVDALKSLLPVRVLSGVDFDSRTLLDPSILDQLVGTFYSYVPSETKPRSANFDHIHEGEKHLRASDIFILALDPPDEREPGKSLLQLSSLVESLLPRTISRDSLWDRLSRQDPALCRFLEGSFSEQVECLKQLPRFSLDQIRQGVEHWSIGLSEAQTRCLCDFLNGMVRPADLPLLTVVLRQIFNNYRPLALKMGRRIGRSPGAVVTFDPSCWGEFFTSLMNDGSYADSSGVPIFSPCGQGASPDLDALHEWILTHWNFPFASPEVQGAPTFAGSPQAVAERMREALSSFERLADTAYQRTGFQTVFVEPVVGGSADDVELADGLACVGRFPSAKIFPYQWRYAQRVREIFGFLLPTVATQGGSTVEARREKVCRQTEIAIPFLSPDALDRVANFCEAAEALNRGFKVIGLTPALTHEVAAGAGSETHKKNNPYSSLRHFFRLFLPPFLQDRFRRFDHHAKTWVEVTTLSQQWRFDLGDAASGMATSATGLGREFLDLLPLLTAEHLRGQDTDGQAYDVVRSLALTDEEIPIFLDLGQGRLRETSSAADLLVERLFYALNTLEDRPIGPLSSGDRLFEPAFLQPPRRLAALVWNPWEERTDRTSNAFLEKHLERFQGVPTERFEGAPLLVLSLPDSGLRLLEFKFRKALDVLIRGIKGRREYDAYDEVEQWALRLAEHPNVVDSERILRFGFDQLFNVFGISGMDGFWEANLRRRTSEPPKALPAVYQRFARSFLGDNAHPGIFLTHGKNALLQGRAEAVGISLACLGGAQHYLATVFGRDDFGIYPFEADDLLPMTDRITRFLLDACLVLKQSPHPRFPNKKAAAQCYYDDYYRLVGGDYLEERLGVDDARKVFGEIPLGAYAEAVRHYLAGPEAYAVVAAIGEFVFLEETTVDYDDRFQEDLGEAVPEMLGDRSVPDSPFGLSGYSPIILSEGAIRLPLAVMVLEAFYRLAIQDPPHPDYTRARLQAMFDQLVLFFPQFDPDSNLRVSEGAPSTFWHYQFCLKAMHYARERLFDFGRADRFRVEALHALGQRSAFDPDVLRASRHFVMEIDRVRFERIFVGLQDRVRSAIPLTVEDVQPAVDSLLNAIKVERQLLQDIERGEFGAGHPLEVPDWHILEYRCTEFQLFLHLKCFLLFLTAHFSALSGEAQVRLPLGALFHGNPSFVFDVDTELNRLSASLQELLAASSSNYRDWWINNVFNKDLKAAAAFDFPGNAEFWTAFMESWTPFAERFLKKAET